MRWCLRNYDMTSDTGTIVSDENRSPQKYLKGI